MDARVIPKYYYTEPQGHWQSWFAWHPVIVDNNFFWLVPVERREIVMFDPTYMPHKKYFFRWEYRKLSK